MPPTFFNATQSMQKKEKKKKNHPPCRLPLVAKAARALFVPRLTTGNTKNWLLIAWSSSKHLEVGIIIFFCFYPFELFFLSNNFRLPSKCLFLPLQLLISTTTLAPPPLPPRPSACSYPSRLQEMERVLCFPDDLCRLAAS
jgi:hypothetical protein